MLFFALLAAAAADAPETRVQSERHTAELHALMDVDHDGYVTYAEFVRHAATMPMYKAVPADVAREIMQLPALREEFALTDTDHDGRWSLTEAIAGADRNFAEADTDHDGLLSLGERVSYQMRNNEKMRAALQALHLACHPGAACETMRRQ